jgi:short subunit fatty acids transporter
LITWGLGLVVGGLLVREVAGQMREKEVRLHSPMLVAAGYSGYMVWYCLTMPASLSWVSMPAISCSCPKTIFQRLPTGLTPARLLTALVGLPLLAYLAI